MDTGHFALEPHVDVIAEHIDKLMTSSTAERRRWADGSLVF
jgi:hypothetical protein